MVNGAALFRNCRKESQYHALAFIKEMHKSHIRLGNVALFAFGF
jgi:hypothetical protein